MDSAQDVVRDAKLAVMGFRVIRFWNNEIFNNLEGVLAVILQHLQASTPLPSPLPQGEREL
jgi:very-short-patch-repair endonuclease